mgnify:CR=1 FL=1
MLCAAAPMRMFSPHWGGCVSRWGLGLIGGPPRTVCLSTLHSHNSNSNNSDSNSNKEDVGVGDEEGAVSLLRVHVTQLQQEVAQLHTLVQSQSQALQVLQQKVGQAGSRSPRETEKQVKPGDWYCSSCSNHNFSWRRLCYRCGKQREDEDSVGMIHSE